MKLFELEASDISDLGDDDLGKFGNQLRYYEIDVNTDPYKPVVAGGFTVGAPAWMPGATIAVAQQVLLTLIP